MTRVLIVEDSPTQAEQLRALLVSDGFEALIARDAASALSQVATGVDLVITDIVMPGMSGYDLCRAIKAEHRERKIPVILLSQLSDPMDIIRGLESGADNFVTKPYKRKHLLERVHTILANRALRSVEGAPGTQLMFLGKQFTIDSGREQILDLLVSTFEDIIQVNRDLQAHRSELAEAKARVEEYAMLLETRVRVSEAKYARLMEHASSAVFVTNVEGRIIDANRAAGTLVGLPPSQLIDRKVGSYLRLGDRTFEGFWESVLRDGSGRSSNASTLPNNAPQAWIDVNAARVRIDNLDLVHVTLHDVTKRTHLEQQLQRAQRLRYALLADGTRELILFIDRTTGQIIEANAAALSAYGYTREEIILCTVFDLRPSESLEEFTSHMERAERSPLFEAVELRKDGSTFPAEITLRGGTVDDRSIVLFVARDITERKDTTMELSRALDGAVKSEQLKSNFVATVSHEIRTPMNGILGMSELLLRCPLEDEALEYAQTIHESSIALLRILNDTLDFSKLEAGRAELETIEFDVAHVVEAVVELMSRAIKRDAVTLTTYVAPDVPAVLRGDCGRLRQILTNLVGNALKFTEVGYVSVAVESVEPSRDGRGVIRCSVSDSGIGMTEEVRQRIFQPFAQGEASTSRRFGGTGLGLAICKAYVELMGGDIELASSPGSGTVVAFTAHFASAERTAGKTRDASLMTGLRMLLLSDDAATSATLERYAHDWGIECDLAASDLEAIHKLREGAAGDNPFAVAVINDPLRGAGALELAALIRRDETIASTRLMLIVAGDADREGRFERARRFDALVSKPIIQSHVFDALITVLTASPVVNGNKKNKHAEHTEMISRPLRVLVAEDNVVNRRVAERQLEILGCSTVFAENGQAAVDAVERETFDLVLMDCNMPVMDGFAATRAIRAWEGETSRARVPIIAMTANATADDRKRCLEAGMDDYASKPILLDALRAVLGRVFPNQEAKS